MYLFLKDGFLESAHELTYLDQCSMPMILWFWFDILQSLKICGLWECGPCRYTVLDLDQVNFTWIFPKTIEVWEFTHYMGSFFTHLDHTYKLLWNDVSWYIHTRFVFRNQKRCNMRRVPEVLAMLLVEFWDLDPEKNDLLYFLKF